MKISCIALLFFVMLNSSFAQESSWPRVYSRVSHSVVKIENPESTGAGFIVSTDGWIVTNRHVVEGYGPSNTWVWLKDDRVVSVRNIRTSRNMDVDLALVQVELSNVAPVPILEYGDASIGENIMVIGHPKDEDWTQFNGTVSRLGEGAVSSKTDLLFDAGSYEGCSGGPIVNNRGVVLGVVHGGRRGAQNMNFAVRASALREFLIQHRVEFATMPLFNLNPEEKLMLERNQLDADRASISSERERIAADKRLQDQQNRNSQLQLEMDRKTLARQKEESAELIAKADAIRDGLDARGNEIDRRERDVENRERAVRNRELAMDAREQNFERDKQRMGYVYPPHFAIEASVGAAYAVRKPQMDMGMMSVSGALLYRLGIDRSSFESAQRPTDRIGVVYSLHRQYIEESFTPGYLHDLSVAFEFSEVLRLSVGANLKSDHTLYSSEGYLVYGAAWQMNRYPIPIALYGRLMADKGFVDKTWSLGLSIGLGTHMLRY